MGFVLDSQHGIFQVPAKRVEALKRLIDTIIVNHFTVSARCLSRLSGSLVSIGLALGPVVCLWTRSIYRDICQANYWDKPFLVSQDSQSEVLFWRKNFDNSGYPIWSPSPKVSEKLYIQRSEGYYPACLRYIDQLWGPHTVDRCASLQTRQLERFCSRYRNPRCEAVDAFTIPWLKENNWIFPPPYLIPRVLKHMSAGGEISTLLIPWWSSAVWWPLLVNTDASWKAFIMGSMTFKP